MVENIGAASTIQPNTIRSDQSVKFSEDAETREAPEKDSAAMQTEESRKRDRYEYSDEYLSDLSAKPAYGVQVHDMPAVQTDESPNDEKSLSSGAETASQDKISSSENASDDDSSESVDTNKLYQYTETELKDFLRDGSITQREYDAEIAKRNV